MPGLTLSPSHLQAVESDLTVPALGDHIPSWPLLVSFGDSVRAHRRQLEGTPIAPLYLIDRREMIVLRVLKNPVKFDASSDGEPVRYA